MAIDADGHVEFGLETSEVAAVFSPVHVVRLDGVEALPVESLAEERNRVGPPAIGSFKAIDKQVPINFLVVIAAQC